MVKVVRRIILLLAIIACSYYTYIKMSDVSIDYSGTIYVVDEFTEPYYEMLSDNVGITNINGISNVYINMERCGYDVFRESVSESSIDVSFVKTGCSSYRYYYEQSSGRITIFSSDYETSYLGVSYIIEEKEVE